MSNLFVTNNFVREKKDYLTKFLCNEYNEDKIFSKINLDKLINKNYNKNESKFFEKKLLDEAYVLYEKMKLNDD